VKVSKVHCFEVSLYIEMAEEEVEKVEKGTKICVIFCIPLPHFCYLQRHVKMNIPPVVWVLMGYDHLES
jgi:hypothetical protein